MPVTNFVSNLSMKSGWTYFWSPVHTGLIYLPANYSFRCNLNVEIRECLCPSVCPCVGSYPGKSYSEFDHNSFNWYFVNGHALNPPEIFHLQLTCYLCRMIVAWCHYLSRCSYKHFFHPAVFIFSLDIILSKFCGLQENIWLLIILLL